MNNPLPNADSISGWRLCISWIVLTVLGCGLGSVLARLIAQPLPGIISNSIGWTVNGAVVGVAQWLVLRRYLRSARFWVPVCAASWLVGLLLFVPGSSFLYALLALLTRGQTQFF